MIGALLAMLVAAGPAPPGVVPEAVAPDASMPADCPPSKIYPPRFPADMLRSGKSGVAKVRATIDACGRVLAVELAETSGHGQLNDAALEAVAGYVLPQSMVARVANGVVILPVKFGPVTNVDMQDIDWPSSHRRPSYIADAEPIAYDTIAAFEDADVLREGPSLKPPYGMVRKADGSVVMTWMQRDKAEASTWWLQYVTQAAPLPSAGLPAGARVAPGIANKTAAVVRYRLGEREGKPAVLVSMLCERPEEECERLREFVMKGLPFAKPAR